MIDLTRQSDLIDTKKLESLRVMVIGAGGIGSFLTYALAKMGIKHIQVWDKDVVESHNIPNQLYSLMDNNVIKVEALASKVRDELGVMLDTKNEFWDGTDISFDPDVIICGVDRMDVRSRLWDGIKKNSYLKKEVFYFDARMSARAMSLFVTPLGKNQDAPKRYEASLFPDEEGVQERCTARAIIHTSFACTYVICNVLHDLINRNKVVASYHANLENMSFSKEAYQVN